MTTQPEPAKLVPLRSRRLSNLDWSVVIGIGALHVGALLAFFPQFFTWTGLLIAVVLYYLTGMVGITVCFHRLLTHRSFKTPKW